MKIKITTLYFIITLSIGFTGCLISNQTVENDFSNNKLFVFGTDFSSGILNRMAADGQKWEGNGLQVHSDSKLKSNGGFLYVMERFGKDNILKLDPAKKGDGAVIYQTHLGDSWNPQDMAFVSETKAYIAVENMPYILIFNPEKGEVTDSILTREYIYEPGVNDSGFAATSPHCHALALHDGFLYAALQRRNGDWQSPGGKSMVLKINTDNDKIEDSILLKHKNSSNIEIVEGDIYVSALGSYGNFEDGALEKIDFNSHTSGIIFTEKQLGGDFTYFTPKSKTQFYALCYVSWGEVDVKLIDISSKKVLSTLPGIVDAGSELLYDPGTQRLFVTERDPTASGLKIFGSNEDLIFGPMQMEVPPASMAIVEPQ